jgi:hypothetical protein
MAFTFEDDSKDRVRDGVFVKDLLSGKVRSLGDDLSQPVWTPSGDQIAIVKAAGEDGEAVVLLSYPDLKPIRTLNNYLNPCAVSFSPDGKWFSVENHLSRPLTGSSLAEVLNGSEIKLSYPERYATPELFDWAPDSRSALFSWRIQNPRNDGDWVREDIGLTQIPSGQSRWLGEGTNAQFSANGRSVLWIVGQLHHRTGDLVLYDLGKRRVVKRLLRGITGYSVRRGP